MVGPFFIVKRITGADRRIVSAGQLNCNKSIHQYKYFSGVFVKTRLMLIICLFTGIIFAGDKIILKTQQRFEGSFIEFENYEYAIFHQDGSPKTDKVLLGIVDKIILENGQIVFSDGKIIDLQYINKVNKGKIKPGLSDEVISPIQGGIYITPGFSYVDNRLLLSPTIGIIFNDKDYPTFLGVSTSYFHYRRIDIVSPSFVMGYELSREFAIFIQGSISNLNSFDEEELNTAQSVVVGLVGIFPIDAKASLSLEIGGGKTFYEKETGSCFLLGADVTKQLRKHLAIQPSIEFGVSSNGAAIGGINFTLII